MSGKITAFFGADFSEAEAAMQKDMASKRKYAAFVSTLDKQTQMTGFSAQAPKILGQVKSLAGAFGAAGAAAGLIPGVGIAAIGLAAVVKGASMIREHYEKIAADAKAVMEYMQRAGERRAAADDSTRTDKERLEIAKQTTEQLRVQWLATLGSGADDVKILAAREAYEIAIQKQVELTRKVKEDASEKESKDREKHSKEEDARAKRELANHAREAEAQKKAQEIAKEAAEKKAEAEKKAADENKKREDEEQKRYQEIDQMEYDRVWRFATVEQRIAQVRKEGREAQARYDKDASSENLLALEKVRKKWLDLRDEVNGAKKDADKATGADGGGREIGEDGKLRLRGAVVSAEDAARSDSTRARNASLTRDSMRGRIRDAGRVGSDAGNQLKRTEDLLSKIEGHLKPKAIKK